jgi:hypothetical protein
MLYPIWDPYIEALVNKVPTTTSKGIKLALDTKASSQAPKNP